MNGRLSRRKIAEYVVAHVRDGVIPARIIEEVAAYLYETRRQREMALVARAIEDTLASHGIVVATVTSARPLGEQLRKAVVNQLGSGTVYLREVVEPSVIGGIRLQTPDASYDGTLAHKLNGLRAAKV